MCFAPQPRALFRDLNFQKWSEPLVSLTFWLPNVLRATTACTFFTSQLPKVVRTWCALYILTWKCCFAPQRRALFRHLNFQKWSENGVLCTFWLGNVLRATTACTFSTSQLPKVVRTWCALYILTWKCASRHNGVHFFDISTSKSGPRMVCFVHFDLEMLLRATTACTFSTSQLPKVVREWCFAILTSKCASRHNAVHFFNISTSKSGPNLSVFNTFYFQMCFAPQRRALFQHLNFQKWSDPEVLCTFSLRNRLRATTACNFSSLISQDVSAPAALASLLFNPPEPQNHKKTQCFATFLPFRAPASSFFWSFLFWLFSLLTAFSSLHSVGSLTSKLPSISSYLPPPSNTTIHWENRIGVYCIYCINIYICKRVYNYIYIYIHIIICLYI